MGSLIAAELSVKYKAQAVEYADVREFPHANSCVLGPAVINTHTVSRSFVPGQLSTSDRPIDHCHNHDTEQSLAVIKLEEAKYASICGSVLAHGTVHGCRHLLPRPLLGRRVPFPLSGHYSLWLAKVGCAKVASANVEMVFSAARRISMKSHCLDPQLLSAALRIILNIEGCGLVATSMHAPSRAPFLLPLLLSHNLPFPRVHHTRAHTYTHNDDTHTDLIQPSA